MRPRESRPWASGGRKLSDFGEEKGIELLADAGLKVSHLLWAGGFTGSDGRSFRASIEDASDALETAAGLKAQTLVVYSGSRAGHTFNHARRLIRDALNELSPLASERGVVLGIEPMHPHCAAEFTFLTGIDETLELLQSVGSPQVKMVFDTYHLGQDREVIGRIAELAGKVAIVQLGDSRKPPTAEQNRCRLGEGCVPLAGDRRRLEGLRLRRFLRRGTAGRRDRNARLPFPVGPRPGGLRSLCPPWRRLTCCW